MADIAAIQPHLESWTSFDWSSTLSTIEATLQQAKEAQKHSAQERKTLSESTKQFKKSLRGAEQASVALGTTFSEDNAKNSVKSVESLVRECKTTIKSYQEAIDNVTRRSKTSEAAYFSLAQALTEQGDPASIMQALAEKLQEQSSHVAQLLRTTETANEELQAHEKTIAAQKKEIQQLKSSGGGGGGGGGSGFNKEEREELISLRREVAEYEVEFRNLKNQDITIRKLEARIEELQTSGEEQLEEQLEKHKEELEEREGRRVAEALEREAALERKVQTLELQLKAERAGREATQAHLLEADEGVSQREAAWEAQRRILVDDSTRLRESLQTTTRERDELRLQVAAFEGRSDPKTPPPSGGVSMRDLVAERKAYEAEVAELSETASLLRDELRLKDEQLEEEQKTSQIKISELQREIAKVNTTVQSLDNQLQSAPSQVEVDSMRRELRILKRLEYNADDIDAGGDPEVTSPLAGDDKDLESVLVSKLRRAETDLVKERIAKTDLVEQVDVLKANLADAERAKEEADKLVFSLEKDLEKAIATPVTPSSQPRKVVPMPKEGDPATLQTFLDPDAPSTPTATSTPTTSVSAAEKADDDHSVATIVMAQRDRLRARCEALEAERDSFKRELQIQVQSSESLKADNTKLYEKVRYLQSFNKTGRRVTTDRDLDLEALEQRYEASVDPFRQFSKAERQRKLNEMPPMERAVFVVAKTVLATKEMRVALFFYVSALHLLVFVTTYHWSHTDGCHNVNNEHLAYLPHEQQTDKVTQAAAAAASDAAAAASLRGAGGGT